eukprot:TRINITY_DN2877_c0_g3_i1.p1 TRINITY_DN2877_c0_g3~~TRINITY_DN2877_c0_g3_i1.p1  ORF type:complete len:1175 (+),score=162.63 TRINITY_DN2877_c0_g3_i1:55-3579(+)
MTSMRVASLLVSTLPTISADLFGFANSSEASIALEDRKLTSLTLAGQEGSDKVELKLRVSILGHLGPQDVTPSEADKKKAEKWIFAAALRSMLYSQDEGFPGPQLDTPPEIQHSVIQPMALNMGRRSPFQKTEFQISCRVRDEPSAIKLGTRFCQDYGDEAQILEIGTVRALDMADLYPREAYDFASKLGKGLPSFIHVSAAYFVNDKLSEGGLCYWESALDDALQLPLCPENSAPLEQSPWGCKCLPGYEGHVEFSHVEDFGGSFEIVGSCTAIREFCPLAGDVELKQKDDEGGAARGVVGEVALPSCKRGYQAEGETTCTEERKWVPDPQHLCHWTPPREQPEPYCERNMLNSTGVQIQGCGLCTISQGASCACAVKCGEDYERSGGGEEGKKECLRETFSCPHKLLFQADICVDEETKRPTHTFCCKEAWGENVPPVSLEIRNCGEISKDRDCLSSKHDGSGGVGNAGEPCCWQKRGRKCAPKSEHLEGATCAATKDAIVSAWSDLPTCNELPEPPPKPVCENVFASIPNLVYENCTDCTPDETCNCTVRCKPGTKQPTGKYAEGSEGIRKCEWRDVGVRAEFEPPPNCQGICETPDNQSGLLDVSLCKEDCVVGDKGCQCTVSCADGTVVFSGRPGKKSCMPTDKGQEYELSPTCRPVCVKPDSQFNLLEVIGCSGCIAGTDCPCRLECRGGNKALKGREGDKVCKLHQASATSMPTAEWADKLKADDEEAVSGVPQCLPPITISVVDAINQEALGGVTIKVYIASSNKEDRLLEVLVTSDSARDKSVMFYCEATSMSVRIEKDGYSSILRQLDRGSNCEDPSKCRFQFSLSKALPGNHLHPQGCFVKGKPRSIEWEMRAVLEWDNSPRDLDIWARNWGCYDAVERGYNCKGSNATAKEGAGILGPFWKVPVCKRDFFGRPLVKRAEFNACAMKGCRFTGLSSVVAFSSETEKGSPLCHYVMTDQFPKWVHYASRYVDSMDRRIVGHDPEARLKGRVQPLPEAVNWNPDHYMLLDVDKKTGYGPETVTFHNVPPGIYQVVVNQFSRGNGLRLVHGNPRVTVYIGRNNVAFECKISPQCVQDAFVWNVVNIEVTAGKAAPDGELEYEIRLIDNEEDMKILRRIELPTARGIDQLACHPYSDQELKQVCYGKCSLVDKSLEHAYGSCLKSRK